MLTIQLTSICVQALHKKHWGHRPVCRSTCRRGINMCLIYKCKLSKAFHLYPLETMPPDTLSVISLRLLRETPCNAILLTICAIWSNIPELGSWKDSKSWNGICFSDYMQVCFYTGPISEKRHGNLNSANCTQNSHLKLYFWGIRGLASCIVYNWTTSGHTDL